MPAQRCMRSPITSPSTSPRPTPRVCASCRRPTACERIVGPLLETRARLETRTTDATCRCSSRSRRIWTPIKSARSPASLRSLGDRRRHRHQHHHRSVGARVPAGRRDRRGGLSGAPLHARSVAVIAQLRAELGGGFPIIGVGGIVDADRALATLRAGADLLQIYTGFAYRGHALLEEILNARCSRTGRGRPHDQRALIEQFQRDGAVRICRACSIPARSRSSRPASI